MVTSLCLLLVVGRLQIKERSVLLSLHFGEILNMRRRDWFTDCVYSRVPSGPGFDVCVV